MITLNWDVLIEILSYLPREQVLLVSTTSKTLRELAIPMVLKEVSLEVKSNRKLNQFITFLLAAVDQRPRLMRRLELHGNNSPYAVHRVRNPLPREHRKELLNEVGFVAALSQACNLRSLRLDWSEDLFYMYKSAPAGIKGLKNIQSLQLNDFGLLALQMVNSMRSTPKSISMSFSAPMSLGDADQIKLSSVLLSTTNWTSRCVATEHVLGKYTVLPCVRHVVWIQSSVSFKEWERMGMGAQ